jgi:hypothetical protein
MATPYSEDPTARDIWRSAYALFRMQANRRQRRSGSAAIMACEEMRPNWHGAPVYFVSTTGGRVGKVYGPCSKLP